VSAPLLSSAPVSASRERIPLPPPPRSSPAVSEQQPRLLCVDALRGFAMFWIIGADTLVHALRGWSNGRFVRRLDQQLEHQEWAGLAFFDVIFPLFLFVVGISLSLSLPRAIARYGRASAARQLLGRAAILFVLGFLYNGGFRDGLEQMRVMGVLQRIALCFAGAGLFLGVVLRVPESGNTGPRPVSQARAVWSCLAAFFVILIGYWLLLTSVPVPGYGPPSYVKGSNLVDWLDARLLPGRLEEGDHDPEGLLSTLPAIGTTLLGVLAGMALRARRITDRQRPLAVAATGLVLLAAGWIWGTWYPVIKDLWTTSFVLVAGGYSFLLLALFYWVMEIQNWRRWARPFVWLGINSIFIYLATSVVDFYGLAQRIVGSDFSAFLDDHVHRGAGALAVALVSLGLSLALVYALHRRRIYFKV
jgi:predicted acyltransferase